MPLTEFQQEVLNEIISNRSEESHFAGGLVLNASKESARYSGDFDIFHDAEAALIESSQQDVDILRRKGYSVEYLRGWETETGTFRKALISRGEMAVKIDWAVDAAIRFFPIERDALLGWRLHLFDMATNKALALSARTETRDYVDIVELDSIYPLEVICWAACGKDPGFSPGFLLTMMRRFAKIEPTTLHEIQARNLDPIELKRQWLEMSIRAESAIEKLADDSPDLPIGVAFLDESGTPIWPGEGASYQIHHPVVGGCWPKLS